MLIANIEKDQISSIDTKDLKDLIKGANILSLQEEVRKITLNKKLQKFCVCLCVSTQNIKKGEKLSKKNIWVKRPGTGQIKADKFYKILGKKSKKFIKKNIQLKLIIFMIKKILFVTATRAEFGKIKATVEKLNKFKNINNNYCYWYAHDF